MKETGKSSHTAILLLALCGLCSVLALGMPLQSLAAETGGQPVSEGVSPDDGNPHSVSGNNAGEHNGGAGNGLPGGQNGGSGGSQDGSTSGQHPSAAQPFTVDGAGRITGLDPAWLGQLTPAQRGSLSLTIPSSINGVRITGIEANAFAASSYGAAFPDLRLTGLVLPSAGLTYIGDNAFYGCSGLKGVLTLSASLSYVGANAFGNTGYSTVYLPDSPGITYGTGAFAGGRPSATVICPSEASYNALKNTGIGGSDKALTYQLTLQFQAGGKVIEERPVLYNRAISLKRQANGSWANQKDYSLPAIPNQDAGSSYRWVFDPASDQEVTPRTLVTGKALTSSRTISPAVITAGQDINKTYDGSAASLEITAEHPLYSPEKDAGDGDVLFYYTWNWQEDGIGKSQEGYDLSSLSFTDSVQTTVEVTVTPSVKGSSESVPGEFQHTFQVSIKRATPEVTPILPSGSLTAEGSFPALSLPDGCIPGSISWDEGQTLKEGEHSYTWIFTPDDETNYNSVTGSCTLTAQAKPQAVCQLTVTSGAHGSIKAEGGIIPDSSGNIPLYDGEELTFSLLPAPGYTVDRLLLDGENVTGQIQKLSYTFRHSAAEGCSRHTLSVSFRKTTSSEMEQRMKELPPVKQDGSCSQETENAYLDTKIAYETLKQDRGLSISSKVLLSFYQSMLKLPSVRLDMDNNSYAVLSHTGWLLENMSLNEAEDLLSGSIREFLFTVDAREYSLSSEQKKAVLNQKKDARIAASYNVSITKTIKKNSSENNYPLSELAHPVTLRLSLPADLKGPAEGYSRIYYVVGIHKEENGKTSLSLLPAKLDTSLSSGPVVTAETSRFSVFSVIYVDQKKESKPQKPSDEDKDQEDHKEESGGSSTYVPDYEKEFWGSVTSLIKKAKAGETVNVNAVTYDKMPEAVMAALRENPNVALIVRWEGGDPVMIPARTALTKDKGRVYYPLSYLSSHYKALNAALIQQQKPGNTSSAGNSSGTAAPGGSSSGGSASSGSGASGSGSGGSKWDISAPSNTGNSYTPTPEDQGVEPETDETETNEAETETLSAEENLSGPEGETQDDLTLQSVTQKDDGESTVTAIVLIVSIVLLVLLVIIFVVLLTLKNRR